MLAIIIFSFANFINLVFTCTEESKNSKRTGKSSFKGVRYKGKYLPQPKATIDNEVKSSHPRNLKSNKSDKTNKSNKSDKTNKSNKKFSSLKSIPRHNNKISKNGNETNPSEQVQHPLPIVDYVKDPKVVYKPKIECSLLSNNEKNIKDGEKQVSTNLKEDEIEKEKL